MIWTWEDVVIIGVLVLFLGVVVAVTLNLVTLTVTSVARVIGRQRRHARHR